MQSACALFEIPSMIIGCRHLTKLKPHHNLETQQFKFDSQEQKQPTMSIPVTLQAATPPSLRRLFSQSEPFIAAPPEDSRLCTPSVAKREQDDAVVLLGPYDIICGRCSTAFNNAGNRRFRATISLYLQRYNEARSREDKGDAIMSVVRILLDNIGARFLKKQGNTWVELGEKKAREKVGHALRDMSVQEQQERRRGTFAKKNKEQSQALVNSSSGANLPVQRLLIKEEEEEENNSTIMLLEKKIAPVDTLFDLTFLDSVDALLSTDDEDELSLDEILCFQNNNNSKRRGGEIQH